MNTLKQLFVSSRPLSWINTAFPFAAAYFMTTRTIDVTFIIGTLFFLIPYNLAMYGINDVFDYESDMRNPRKGGVEGAVLDRSLHRITLWAALLMGLTVLGMATLLLGLVVIAPWLAHASWHAYRDLIDTEGWPERLNPRESQT